MNEKYINALADFVNSARSSTYSIVGSVALLSYTKPNGYDREIHDIDIIMETSEAATTAERLLRLGYKQNTFINPRMPFYNRLMRYAQNKYLRFSKENTDLEILSTSIEQINNLVLFELYPGIKAGVPKDVFVSSAYGNVDFKTVSKEMLYIFKKLATNTLGKKVKYKEKQRYNDTRHLEKLIDRTVYREVATNCRLSICGIRVRLPSVLLYG
jgi:hypothetical protein